VLKAVKYFWDWRTKWQIKLTLLLLWWLEILSLSWRMDYGNLMQKIVWLQLLIFISIQNIIIEM